MEPRISLITLGVSDLARARRFYTHGLGWRESAASQESVAFYQMGGSALALWSRALLAADAGAPNDGAGFDGTALSHNVASRAAVDVTLAEAERAGGSITRPAHDQPWGGYSGYFADPEGHR